MVLGGSVICGLWVGLGLMGEQDCGYYVECVSILYWDVFGNEIVWYFVVNLFDEEILDVIDSLNFGLFVGCDKVNLFQFVKMELYKMYFVYVKECCFEIEVEQLLDEVFEQLCVWCGILVKQLLLVVLFVG